MNKKNIIDVKSYVFSEQDKLLLDTNIWLHIYASKSNSNEITKTYQYAFAKMLAAKSLLFVDIIILSEFVSNYARLRNPKPPKKFKLFRNSEDFQLVAKEIANSTHEILKYCQDSFNAITLKEVRPLLDNFANSGVDFNDQMLVEICNKNQITLVTDDSDFKNANCRIITANQQMLD